MKRFLLNTFLLLLATHVSAQITILEAIKKEQGASIGALQGGIIAEVVRNNLYIIRQQYSLMARTLWNQDSKRVGRKLCMLHVT